MPYTSTCIELQDEEIDAENQRSSQLSAQLMQRYRKNQGLNPCLPQFLFATALCWIRCFLLPLFNNMVNGKEFIFCPCFKFGGDKIWIRSSPDVTYIPNLCHLVT